MTTARARMDASTKRYIWALIILWALIIAGIYVYAEVPAAEHAERTLATTIVPGEYADPLAITGGTLISSRPSGMTGELVTMVEYQVGRAPENYSQKGPLLVARVMHDSGATMTCRMGKTYLLNIDPSTYTLRCDRTVDVDKLGEWSTAELMPMIRRPVKYG